MSCTALKLDIFSENIELLNSTDIDNISDIIYALAYLQNNTRYHHLFEEKCINPAQSSRFLVSESETRIGISLSCCTASSY